MSLLGWRSSVGIYRRRIRHSCAEDCFAARLDRHDRAGARTRPWRGLRDRWSCSPHQCAQRSN